MGVDPSTMIDLSLDFFFLANGEEVCVSFEEFMEMVLDARGGQQATVKDIMHLGKRFNEKFMSLKGRIDSIDRKVDEKFMSMKEGMDSIDSKLHQIISKGA